MGLGDENTAASVHGSLFADFDQWKNEFITHVIFYEEGQSNSLSKKKFVIKNNEVFPEPLETTGRVEPVVNGVHQEEEDNEDEFVESSSEEDEKVVDSKVQNGIGKTPEGLVDLEDIGSLMSSAKKRILREKNEKANGILRDMVTPEMRQILTKQGYKIIGSHSGVKLCRWTKAMLRGRGGCYKHTFYGIQSHQCMEATPSLACANKCTFCWRHNSHPVGTEWKWNMDEAEKLVKESLANHYKMIKEFQGVPGVSKEKIEEGLRARHCALSLVGEPIMYPEINKFVKLLHDEKVSTFLVTNAQFPDAIK